VQFPVATHYAWSQATSACYDEFDTVVNVELHSYAATVVADSGKLGDSIVYLMNSVGLRTLMTATKSNATNIAGIYTYESMGYVFTGGTNVTNSPGSFGPGFRTLLRLTRRVQETGADSSDSVHLERL
jgi:hypothetical protein